MSGWRATLRRLEWPILWALVVLAFVLGMVGFSTAGGAGPSVADRVYRTLQLFVLGGNFEGRLGWELEVAGRDRLHREGERQQQRHAVRGSQPRQHSHKDAQHHAHQHEPGRKCPE